MASGTQDSEQQQIPVQRLQIYSTTNTGVSPFWREKYEREAKRYWDVFYKRHQDRFFKDRHYLDKEWGSYFSGAGRKVILEVGCGAGNTIFPVIASYPDAFVYACDFSPRAIELVKTHKQFEESRVSAFVSDLTADDLCKQISPSSVDIVTMCHQKRCIKYCRTLERLSRKDSLARIERLVIISMLEVTALVLTIFQMLTNLFEENGFDVEELAVCCK